MSKILLAKNKIQELKKENSHLKKENEKLKKQTQYYKSTKAYRIWKKFHKNKKNNQPKKINQIKVAIIADQFTYDSFKYEFIPVILTPDNWKNQFENNEIDIFFCESAWLGYTGNVDEKPWIGRIYKNFNIEGEDREVLLEIIKYCRDENIPTVFWNKEDPPHYRTESLSFAITAAEFDYIFTTSKECIKHYKKDFNHPHVYSLMFAGQPKLFNPLNLSKHHIDEVVFAGSYYANHPQRAKLMEDVLDELLSRNIKFKIYDRNYYNDWGFFPDRFIEFTNPPIDYKETVSLYKQADWGLNFNTVTQSETMFARRVFELALSYVNIITNYSLGVNKLFKDNIFEFDKNNLPDFNLKYDDKRLNNLYNVLENHTYKNRWQQILNTIGFEYVEDKQYITIIFKINDLNQLDEVLKSFNEITYDEKILKLIINQNVDEDDIKNKYPQITEIGHCLNDLNIDSEYYCILTEKINADFIKNGILHYQYLNKRVSIAKGEDKFQLGVEDNIENKIINKINLNNDDGLIDVYYI